MEQTPLSAQPRTVLGRKVKQLRAQGLIPAHIFGHDIPTVHIQVNAADFAKVFEKVGETGIVDLSIDKQKRPVMVRGVQIHHLTDQPLHIDFYQVNLSEKVTVNVPLEIVGEAPAVAKKVGLLLTPISEIEIEALPTDIPENIEVDISKLENIGDEIKVKDLKVDKSKVEVHTDEELTAVSIGELVTKEMEAVEAEAEAEAEAAAAEEGKAAEGEKAELEEKAADGSEEEKTEVAKGEPQPEGRGEEKVDKGEKTEEKPEPKKD